MYVFLVILVFGKKNSISSVRTETEQKKREPKYSISEIFYNRTVLIFSKLETESKNRMSTLTRRPLCPRQGTRRRASGDVASAPRRRGGWRKPKLRGTWAAVAAGYMASNGGRSGAARGRATAAELQGYSLLARK